MSMRRTDDANRDPGRIVNKRFPCRAFRSEPIPRADMEQVLQTALKALPCCDTQPWQVIVTQGQATDNFRAALQAETTKNAPKLNLPGPESCPGVCPDRRRTEGWQLGYAIGVKNGNREVLAARMMRNFTLFDAPHVAFLSSPRALDSFGAMDSDGFVLSFTLAARALGIDTIPMAEIANYPAFVHDYFDIGEDRVMLCALFFGYTGKENPAHSFHTTPADLSGIAEWRS